MSDGLFVQIFIHFLEEVDFDDFFLLFGNHPITNAEVNLGLTSPFSSSETPIFSDCNSLRVEIRISFELFSSGIPVGSSFVSSECNPDIL